MMKKMIKNLYIRNKNENMAFCKACKIFFLKKFTLNKRELSKILIALQLDLIPGKKSN